MFSALSHLKRRTSRLSAAMVAGAALAISGCATAPATAPAEAPAPAQAEAAPAPVAQDIGLYELRVYTAAEGKMADLHARFRDHTVDLFEKHGMVPVLFSTPVVQEGQPEDNRLFYIMAYKDRAARDESWRAFASDPEWRAVYEASQADGSLTSKIENYFLTPAEYSPLLNLDSVEPARTFELRTYEAAPGKLEAIHARFRDHTRRIFDNHGMTNVLYWRPVEGQETLDGKMMYLLAFPGVAARNQAWRDFAADPEWQKVAADSQVDGQLLAGRPESVLLRPTDYSPVQ